MDSFSPGFPPTDRQIDDQIQLIRESLQSDEQDQLLLYLTQIYRDNPLMEPDCFAVIMGFNSFRNGKRTLFKKRPKNLKEKPIIEQQYNTGRTEASSLRRALKDYYTDRKVPVKPPTTEIVLAIGKGLAEAIVHISIPPGRRFGYKPAITWSYRPFTSKELADAGHPAKNPPDELVNRNSSEVRCIEVGTNAEGIRYIADRIPFATRVEDTVVRWNITDSLYEGEDFKSFKTALRESQAEFVVITGPMKDNSYVQAVKEVFGDLTKQRQLTCYQLHHTAPIMNFILLQYKEEPAEVLFGWGTQHGDYTREETKVFRSQDERLVNEYQRLFKVLQSKKFSSRINVSAPTFMKTHQEKCDVLATFKEIPRRLLCELMESKDCQVIKIGITGSVELENTAISEALEKAIRRNVSVQILLSHPKCRFLELRSKKTGKNLEKLVLDNIAKLRQVALQGPLEVRLTSDAMSVAYFQVDTTVIFSPFWSQLSSSEGYQFATYSTLDTGKFLFEDQFKSWWDKATDLPAEGIPPVQE